MKKRNDLFIGYKASRAIPIRDNLTRDFLIQSTLDGDVHRIEYQNNVIIDERIVAADGIIVERFDGRYAVDIVDARPSHDPAAEALTQLAFARRCHGIIELRAADVRAEPRCSAAREVWSHRGVRVHADDRAGVLETLESEGPVGLAQLAESVAMRGEARAVIYALACDGAVELDLSGGLADEMIVRSGYFGPAARLHAYSA
ncbi:hypothetical protein M2189_002768 [Bradyrhizobium japonicum]|uniref:hypothetical protein n=1 Tax=Bradyrhizobium japonicum TaxID=375 RepID=UPI002169E530|nr:hypothetical protein [Bradyrhizobium japonicum]MCS3498274.1 hypothetical protein [Bradyrhizobium japonicum]MCS3959565.1 hypothetical protein [Bradyrhizobium japonicum]MCS4001319.1 hypothetical protein [Bradyrhizobium japonicum]